MSYAQWESWKKSENRYVWETYQKKGQNYSADQKQYAEYSARLGKNAPKTFAEFQNLKYNNTDGYESLKGLYRYKGRVPEATRKDYEAYLKVKATGVIGSVRVPPEPIDSAKLDFKDAHGIRHGCTIEDARNYIDNAKCSVRREKWDGTHTNYYSLDGAAFVEDSIQNINTAFSKAQFKGDAEKIAEVFK